MDGIKEEILENVYEQLTDNLGLWTQDEVNYVTESPEELNTKGINCGNCTFFNEGTCELVNGVIEASGYCRLYVEPCPLEDEESEAYSFSQSILDLETDEDFLYILSLLKDEGLANYKFETLLENLITDLCSNEQQLSTSKAVSLVKEDKSESGGLTEKSRAKYNKNGSELKAPANKKPTTLEQLRRQGMFLSRMFNRDKIPPLKLPNGKPTRYALQASIWNSPIPKTVADVKRLGAKGEALLKKYAQLKEKNKKQKLSQTQVEEVELPICLSNGMVRIPIAKKGSWFHDTHGLVSFTQKDFDQIKLESSKEVLGFTPYITYGHPTNLGYETVDAELKKGDLTGWEEKDDILFGLFDAKEDVVSLITNKDYEYSSGEFIRNYRDKFTGDKKGTVLMRVALTNSPFIPFGDVKVENLSNNFNNSLPSTVPFVIKLSTDSVIKEDFKSVDSENNIISNQLNMSQELNIETPEVKEETVSVIEEVKEPKVSEPVVTVPTVVNVPPTIVTPPTAPVVSVPVVAAAPSLDVNELIKTITENFKAQIDAVKAESASLVNSLKAEVATVTSQLVSQQEVTQAFSNTLAQKSRQAFYKTLSDKGVTPVLIQKFSVIESALNSNQKVIKLSNSAGQEQDQELVHAIADLLVEATVSEPVTVQQFGQSLSVPQVNALQSDMQRIIEANKAKAQQLKIQ